jgi:hypothetical protein
MSELKAVDDTTGPSRKHNVRCERAKAPRCKCSCKGTKHGIFTPGRDMAKEALETRKLAKASPL